MKPAGLPVLDLAVVLAYLGGITVLGMYVSGGCGTQPGSSWESGNSARR